MAHGAACKPVSPGFRRGLFVTFAVQEAPGGNPGTPGVKNAPPSMPNYRFVMSQDTPPAAGT